MSALCTRKLVGRGECRTVLAIETDGHGAVRVHCYRCAWQQAGRCWLCGKPRDNNRKKGVYCAGCADQLRRERSNTFERSPRAKKLQKERDRARGRSEKRRAWQKAWREANPQKAKQYKRRAALNPTPRRKERERYHNSRPERIAAKRAHAKARYYELHPTRPQPRCRDCGEEINYTPPGRPRVKCEQCAAAKRRAA